MTQFSTTRLADYQAAIAGNVHLAPAIAALAAATPLGRLTNIEIFEAIQNAVANGGFVITFSGNSIP